MGYHRELEVACETLKKMHRRGSGAAAAATTASPGSPHGTNAKDLEYFVSYLGFTPMEALRAATILRRADHAARRASSARSRRVISPTSSLVDGDPVADVARAAGQSRIVGIMKDGAFHKDPPGGTARGRWSLPAA